MADASVQPHSLGSGNEPRQDDERHRNQAAQHDDEPRQRNARRQVRALPFVSAAGVAFAVLLVLVRTKWAPLASVDHGIAVDLNADVAPHPLLVTILKRITLLGSAGVLWWVMGISAIVLLARRRYRLTAYLAVAGL